MLDGLWTNSQIILWIVTAPLIVWLGTRFPFGGSRWWRVLGIHCVACVVFVTFSLYVTGQIRPESSTNFGPPAWIASDPSELEIDPLALERYRFAGPPPPAQAAFALMIYTALASLGQGIAWSRRARLRERQALVAEAQLAQAQLSALQMQLNPHFLFNTLNGISTLIHSDPQAAQDMLSDLGQLLRDVLLTEKEPQVVLARELDFLDTYLAIEQRRFGKRLRIERAIDADALSGYVPALILQPLVENAIKHGIESRRNGGVVRIEAARSDDLLCLRVSDSGPGIGQHIDAENSDGIGLVNTRQRLEHWYGRQHEFHVENGALGGCAVSLNIPYHDAAVGLTEQI